MKRLTLEDRVSRLERLINKNISKNEFLCTSNKPKISDEREWVSKLFTKYPSLKRELDTNLNSVDNSTEDKTFHLILTTRDENYNGLNFVISTKGDRGNMYCTAFDRSNTKIAGLKKFHLDKELNQCAMFILKTLQCETANEGKYRRRKCENVTLTRFDCESIEQILSDYFDDLPEVEVDVTDDNSDYGFINVGIYNPEYITSYDIIVNDVESVDVEHEGKEVGTAKSIEDAAEMLAKHFMKDYINGKYKKKDK